MLHRKNTALSWTRSGFTLLEIVVCIGVIGILMSILLPAVQSAREAARKTHCQSNLKQIMLAFHEHEATYRVFPGAMAHRESWFVQILPLLEKQKPRVVNGLVIGESGGPLYACPSDPFATGKATGGDLSYMMNNGHGNHRRDGFFAGQGFQPIRPAEVSDGLSRTAAIAEQLVTLPADIASATDFDSPAWKHRLVLKTTSFIPDYDEFADECEHRSQPPLYSIYMPDSYTHIQTPNRKSCQNGPLGSAQNGGYDAVTASSLHPGGAYVAMGDGSVHFVSDSIDRGVWRAIGTRNGNETVSNDDF